MAVLAAPRWQNATWFEGKPELRKIAWFMADMAIFTGAGAIFSNPVWGRFQGHLWVISTIRSCFYGLFWICSVFASGLLPHIGPKHPNTPFFYPKYHFWPMIGKINFFCSCSALFFLFSLLCVCITNLFFHCSFCFYFLFVSFLFLISFMSTSFCCCRRRRRCSIFSSALSSSLTFLFLFCFLFIWLSFKVCAISR